MISALVDAVTYTLTVSHDNAQRNNLMVFQYQPPHVDDIAYCLDERLRVHYAHGWRQARPPSQQRVHKGTETMNTKTSTSKLPMAATDKKTDVADPTAKAPKTPGGVDISAAKAKASSKDADAAKFVGNYTRLTTLAALSFDALAAEVGDVGATPAELADTTKWLASDDEKLLTANRSPIRNAIIAICRANPGVEARAIHLIMRATAGESYRGSYDKGYLYAPNSKTRGMEARGLVIRQA